MGGTAAALHQRFSQLYGRRLYLHHYTQFIDPAELDAASEAVASLADAYQQLGASAAAAVPPNLAQLRPGKGCASDANGGPGKGCASDASGGFGQNSLRQERPGAPRRAGLQGGSGGRR